MKHRSLRRITLFLLLVPLNGIGAQEPPTLAEPIQSHPEGDAAIDRLKSPYCPGLMLEVCPTPDAKRLRDTLQAMAHTGTSSDSLVAWMLATFGEEYRAVPQTRGNGLWAWLMPPLALLAGLLFIVATLRQFRARQAAETIRQRPLSQEDESVLAAALQELKAAEEVPF